MDWHQKAFHITIPPLPLLNCKKERFLNFTLSSLLENTYTIFPRHWKIHPYGLKFQQPWQIFVKRTEVVGCFPFQIDHYFCRNLLVFILAKRFNECTVSYRQGDSKYHTVTYIMWLKNEKNSKTEVRKMHYVQKIYYISIIMLVSYSALIINTQIYLQEPTRNSVLRIICLETTKRI